MIELICSDPEGFNQKRRKTAEQSYTRFMTDNDFSRLPKTLFPFNGKLPCPLPLLLCTFRIL